MFVFLFSIPYREKKKTYFFTHALLTYDIKNQTCIVMTGDILHGNYNDKMSFNWGKKGKKKQVPTQKMTRCHLCFTQLVCVHHEQFQTELQSFYWEFERKHSLQMWPNCTKHSKCEN